MARDEVSGQAAAPPEVDVGVFYEYARGVVCGVWCER